MTGSAEKWPLATNEVERFMYKNWKALATRGVVRGVRAGSGRTGGWRIFFRGCFWCFSRSFFFHFFEGVSNAIFFDF